MGGCRCSRSWRLLGALLILWKLYRDRRLPAQEGFVLSAAVLWLLVFFGRPTWGPLLLLLGATRDLHLHRVVGAVQIFFVLLAAIAMAAGWRELARRGYVVGGPAAHPGACSRPCCRNAHGISPATRPMEPK